MNREKVRRPVIAVLLAIPLAEVYSAVLKFLNQPMDNAWVANTFFLVFQPLLIYFFCREEKRAEMSKDVVTIQKAIISRNPFKKFWFWLESLARAFAAWFNRFMVKLRMKNLFYGNIAVFIMAVVYFRLATMTLGLKRKPWQFLFGYVPGFAVKLFVAQKTGEGAAIIVKWLWKSLVYGLL